MNPTLLESQRDWVEAVVVACLREGYNSSGSSIVPCLQLTRQPIMWETANGSEAFAVYVSPGNHATIGE